MKKIYTFITFLLVAGIVFGQLQQFTPDNGYVIKSTKKVELNRNPGKATIDTAGWTANYVPQFGSPDGTSVSPVIMADQIGNHIGYWFGTSGDQSTDSLEADWWSQCWVNTANLNISGVLFWAAGKTQLSPGTGSNLIVGIQQVLPYLAGSHGCVTATTPTMLFGPSPVSPFIKQATVNIVDFDTTFATFNWAPFTTVATITGTDFAAVANFKAMRVAGDTAYMFCDVTGNGLALNYTQYNYNTAAYYWVSSYLSGQSASLDVNMSIFAVIDDGAGIYDEGYFQGMKMSLRNNPSSNLSYVDYMLQNSGQTKLVVLDSRGREVSVYKEGFKTAGNVNSIAINTSELVKGTYFLMLSSGGGVFTKKLVVQ